MLIEEDHRNVNVPEDIDHGVERKDDHEAGTGVEHEGESGALEGTGVGYDQQVNMVGEDFAVSAIIIGV